MERSDPDRVLTACPDLAIAHALAGDFSAITRERRAPGYDPAPSTPPTRKTTLP
ncbi:hypothetical protein [Embleya scabrispora]|uniref:hypothetical protein n=1 Tax=Embleya scabrispora TaxID=159449 RepID=UPI001374CD4C|nr:hypothetical protein [Embleya scabrispora]